MSELRVDDSQVLSTTVEQEPGDAPSTVVTSLEIAVDVYLRLQAAAEKHGTTIGALMREALELHLATLEDDVMVSRADVLRAVAALSSHDDG